MKRTSVAALVALLVVAAGTAQARPDVRKMTCAEANAMVVQNGAIVMTTGVHTYRRFVSNVGYCEFDQIRRTYVVPTRDNPRCRLNGICDQSPFDDLPGFGD